MDLIKCPDCGEMYSSSYPHCPFCEEDGDSSRKIKYTPKRHIADKHKAQSARGGLIVVLVLVLALLGWYLFGGNIAARDKADGEQGDTPSSQNDQPAVPVSNPAASSDPFYQPPEDTQGGEDTTGEAAGTVADPSVTEPVTPQNVVEENVDVSNAALNRSDFTLSGSGDSFRVKVSGTEATPHWSIDNGNVASIKPDGTVTALANGSTTLRCKVGTRELTCVVRVSGTGKNAAPADAPTVAETVTPTAPAAPGTASTEPSTPSTTTQPDTTTAAPGTTTNSNTHVDASSLSVKTNYGTTLQKDPDEKLFDCTVKIGGDPITLKIVGTDVPVSSWTSSNPAVVEISSDGKLTPKSSGRAYVTATVGDATVKCIIRVR